MTSINLHDWIIFLGTAVVSIVIMYVFNWLLLSKHKELTADQRLPRQLSMLVVTIVAVIAIILSLPVTESSRNQLLGLFGVLLSGMIAFSSTNIVSNVVAGLVLKLNKPFGAGDFITCKEIVGRVTERGLLDTEVQTEARTLIHVANSFLVNNPVEVVRNSGTIISAEVSIGYDVHHGLIEQHLLTATQSVGLTDAFIHITELGNYSINYKASGLLADTKSMLTTKSRLHAAILDELHDHDIEIMSPRMIASRAVDPDYSFIARVKTTKTAESVSQEDIVFDKAEEAEQHDRESKQIKQQISDLKALLAGDIEKLSAPFSASIEDVEQALTSEQKAEFEKRIKALEAALIALVEQKVDPDLSD